MSFDTAIDATGKRVLTFDCYGTLIDWESGILARVRPWLAAAGRADIPDDLVLSAFALHQARHQQPRPALPYPEVLSRTWGDIQATFGLPDDAGQCAGFAASCGDWPPFPDTVAALRRLSTRFALVILSNVDDTSLAHSLRMLEVPFLLTVTAERVGSYKPGLPHFETAVAELAARGFAKPEILHVAQSRHHDVDPAARLGIPTVWVNRRHGKRGTGATIANAATPISRVPSLAALADALGV
ncbi:haloacid dehalogenase [Roseomonas hellenica]|uniref:Haloacid dehalogenase n=1 Tax=Plastoroseomonas hellenica TaxID=2687306 RepID=A0ABS5EZW7_9PROT|nr:haloacid dehalogenase [Plastoroseomonas hellenica]MBR0665832.1 haloacid dehalogenase [Plastoroseomonas hellenica]